MAIEFVQRPVDEGFLISESNGYQSRDTITLKSGRAYDAGSVLIAELHGDDEATGLYVLATKALVLASPEAGLVVLARFKDATAASQPAAAIVYGAEVKDTELVVGAATTVADVAAGLAINRIKIVQAL
ncbi:head decoration protein [Agrobacterium genomosp. 2]|uniref:Head decoration protein n=1 Tax=Agrobacterium genomosp. 2 str. CFBP 5494 TaxID=1183436 RepID=A0A9W5AZE1_9HYPH|nr:head decoration protein [Agrobacterium genomosp. 2]CUW87487.1 conserved hypothetical protein [Agrobacterium genomosp. 2 str. CFBP 5494]